MAEKLNTETRDDKEQETDLDTVPGHDTSDNEIPEVGVSVSLSATNTVDCDNGSEASNDVIKDAAKQFAEELARHNEMKVLLVGKSGVGKSSFVNCLLQANKAPVGKVRPETGKVTEYDLILNTEGDDRTTIKVYDTPGFGTNKRDNEKFVAEIRKKCEIVDVIFLCIRMDDQLRVEDRQTIALLVKKFDDKFWGKCVIVFTRANAVKRMGQHKDESESDKEYLRVVRDELKEDVQKVFEKTKVKILPPFVLAGAPEFTPEGRMIPSIDNDAYKKIDWLPQVATELFKSGCSSNAKAILLKSGLKKWIGVSVGAGAGTVLGLALGGGIVAVGVITLVLPLIGPIVITIGSSVIAVSLGAGATSVVYGGKAAVEAYQTKTRVDKKMTNKPE